MQSYLIMKRIMDIINGKVALTEENVTTFSIAKNSSINDIDRKMKDLIDSAVKKYGFLGILLRLSCLNLTLPCHGFTNCPLYSFVINDFQNRIIIIFYARDLYEDFASFEYG